jgi:hypothetical protein
MITVIRSLDCWQLFRNQKLVCTVQSEILAIAIKTAYQAFWPLNRELVPIRVELTSPLRPYWYR